MKRMAFAAGSAGAAGAAVGTGASTALLFFGGLCMAAIAVVVLALRSLSNRHRALPEIHVGTALLTWKLLENDEKNEDPEEGG